MERDQASQFVHELLKLLISRNGSDLFITADFPPAIKVDGKISKISSQATDFASHASINAFNHERQANGRV